MSTSPSLYSSLGCLTPGSVGLSIGPLFDHAPNRNPFAVMDTDTPAATPAVAGSPKVVKKGKLRYQSTLITNAASEVEKYEEKLKLCGGNEPGNIGAPDSPIKPSVDLNGNVIVAASSSSSGGLQPPDNSGSDANTTGGGGGKAAVKRAGVDKKANPEFAYSYLKLEQDRLALRQKILDRQLERDAERAQQRQAKKNLEDAKASRGTKESDLKISGEGAGEETAPSEIDKQAAMDKAFAAKIELGLVKAVETQGGNSSIVSSDEIGLARRPEPWEKCNSFILTIPAGCIPNSFFDQDGQLSKQLALEYLFSHINGVVAALQPDYRFNVSNLAGRVYLEKSVPVEQRGTVDLTKLDYHVHYTLYYNGKWIKTAHLWEQAFAKNGFIIDVRTFEQLGDRQKAAGGKKQQDTYMMLLKRKGFVDLNPLSTGAVTNSSASSSATVHAAYQPDKKVARTQEDQLTKLMAGRADRKEQIRVHREASNEDCRHTFLDYVRAKVAPHRAIAQTNRKKWRELCLYYHVYYRTEAWLTNIDAEAWDGFYEESIATLLTELSSYHTWDFLVEGESGKCYCIEQMTRDQLERREKFKLERKVRAEAESVTAPRGEIAFVSHTSREVAMMVQCSTTFENFKRTIKFQCVSAVPAHRDIRCLGSALGKWTYHEATECGASGKDRNICLKTQQSNSGKTHAAETLLAIWLHNPHLIHKVTSDDSGFNHEGASREKSQRFKYLSDWALGGMKGSELKQLAENSATRRVKVKKSSIEFGKRYSPCVLTTNITNIATFRAAWNLLPRAAQANFTEDDYRKTLEDHPDEKGRFESLEFGVTIPDAMRYAPETKQGAIHTLCNQCCSRSWRWLSHLYLSPRIFTANQIHVDSDDEDFVCSTAPIPTEYDDRDTTPIQPGQMKTRDQADAWIRRGLKYKAYVHEQASAVKEATAVKGDSTSWVKITGNEKKRLATMRANGGTKRLKHISSDSMNNGDGF